MGCDGNSGGGDAGGDSDRTGAGDTWAGGKSDIVNIGGDSDDRGAGANSELTLTCAGTEILCAGGDSDARWSSVNNASGGPDPSLPSPRDVEGGPLASSVDDASGSVGGWGGTELLVATVSRSGGIRLGGSSIRICVVIGSRRALSTSCGIGGLMDGGLDGLFGAPGWIDGERREILAGRSASGAYDGCRGDVCDGTRRTTSLGSSRDAQRARFRVPSGRCDEGVGRLREPGASKGLMDPNCGGGFWRKDTGISGGAEGGAAGTDSSRGNAGSDCPSKESGGKDGVYGASYGASSGSDVVPSIGSSSSSA